MLKFLFRSKFIGFVEAPVGVFFNFSTFIYAPSPEISVRFTRTEIDRVKNPGISSSYYIIVLVVMI